MIIISTWNIRQDVFCKNIRIKMAHTFNMLFRLFLAEGADKLQILWFVIIMAEEFISYFRKTRVHIVLLDPNRRLWKSFKRCRPTTVCESNSVIVQKFSELLLNKSWNYGPSDQVLIIVDSKSLFQSCIEDTMQMKTSNG